MRKQCFQGTLNTDEHRETHMLFLSPPDVCQPFWTVRYGNKTYTNHTQKCVSVSSESSENILTPYFLYLTACSKLLERSSNLSCLL